MHCAYCKKTILDNFGSIEQPLCKQCRSNLHSLFEDKPQVNTQYQNYKSRSTAAILALLLGGIGVHRFYLGQKRGLLYLLFCWTFLPLVISLFEFLLFIVMSDNEWNHKYNNKYN